MPINSSRLGLGSTDRHFNEVRLFWRLMRLGHIEICVLERLGEENFQKHSIPCDEGTLCILFQLNIWAPIRVWRSDAHFSEAKRAYSRPAMSLSTWDEALIPLKVPSVADRPSSRVKTLTLHAETLHASENSRLSLSFSPAWLLTKRARVYRW